MTDPIKAALESAENAVLPLLQAGADDGDQGVIAAAAVAAFLRALYRDCSEVTTPNGYIIKTSDLNDLADAVERAAKEGDHE